MATESQLRANKKWQAGKICSLACRVKVSDAEKFRRYCAARGQTPNAVLTAYVQECGREMDDLETETPNTATQQINCI